LKIFKLKIFIGFVVAILVIVGGFTADAYTHTITLKQGSSGTQVISLQSALGGLVADGIFGPLTKAAVKAFQLARDFSVDGIVGPITGGALSNIVNSSYPAGCTSTSEFSSTTGMACSTTMIFPVGCTSVVGYSPITGLACDGCTGLTNFSPITGSPCFKSVSHSSRRETIISTSAIAGVTVPATGETPTATIADTTEYTATITWNGSPETFASATIYTATITITPKSGYTLTGVTENFFTVAGGTATNAINSGTVTVVFPVTETVLATVPSNIELAVGSTNPVGGVTNVAIPAAGATDTTGAVTGWVTETADEIIFTVTDGGSAVSTITINDVAYTSGEDYTIAAATSLTIVVTTIEAGKTNAVRTFTVTVAAPAGVARYWVGGSGSWLDATNHWATTSGGTPGADNLPTELDNVFFDENSGLTDGTVSLDFTEDPLLWAVCKDITSTTGVSYAFTEGDTGYLEIHGSITLESGNSFGSGVMIYVYGGNGTITSNNVIFPILLIMSGTYELSDDITITEQFVFDGTLFNTNNYNITAADFYVEATSNDITFNMGSSTFTTTSDTTAWQVTDYGENTVTINSGTSTIISTGTGGADFWGSGKTYYNLEFNGDPTTYDEYGNPNNYAAISGSNIFNTLTIGPGIPVMFPTESPQTMNDFVAIGTETDPIPIYSDDNNPSTSVGSTIIISSGIISCDYLDISFMNATGGATFYAGANSVDGGHNTGWTFTAPP